MNNMEINEKLCDMLEEIKMSSPDPSTKTACIIIDKHGEIINTAYNGFINDCDTSKLSLERPDKYSYIAHAEFNAVVTSGKDLSDNCVVYCSYLPCINCFHTMWQAGIKDIRYKELFVNSKNASADGGKFYNNDTWRILITQFKACGNKLKITNAVNGKTFWEEIEELNKND